jgi:hypothetical protein
MSIAVIVALLVFWLALAWRQYQRGDMLLAGIFLLAGVVLTVYRYRAVTHRTEQAAQADTKDPLK